MKYSRPPWPKGIYPKFSEVAEELGYKKRGTRWLLLDKLLDFARKNKKRFEYKP